MKIRITLLIITILAGTLTASAHESPKSTPKAGAPVFAKIKSPDYLRVNAGYKHSNDLDELLAKGVPAWRVNAVRVAMTSIGSDLHECSICGCVMISHFLLCTLGSIGPVCFTWSGGVHTCTTFIID